MAELKLVEDVLWGFIYFSMNYFVPAPKTKEQMRNNTKYFFNLVFVFMEKIIISFNLSQQMYSSLFIK